MPPFFFLVFFSIILSETKAGAVIRITRMKIQREGRITFRATSTNAPLFPHAYKFTATAARF